MRASSGAISSASFWAIPDEGSSSNTTRGSAAITHAMSRMRRWPVLSSRTNLSRVGARAKSSIRRSTRLVALASERRTLGRWSAAAAELRLSRWRSRATRRFSRTVRFGKRRASWKERRRPAPTRASGPRCEMSSPKSSVVPRLGRTKPEMTSNRVVLPAPLGPMKPRARPSSRVKLTSFTARMPPKETVT